MIEMRSITIGEKAYAAFNTYCPEYDIIVGTRFQAGNVTAGYKQLEELKQVLSTLPEGVEDVTLRSDSAGYQEDIIRYCAEGTNERFGVINFTISCKVGASFKQDAKAVPEEDWKPVMKETKKNGVIELQKTGQEWAEVNYVPDWVVQTKRCRVPIHSDS